MIRFLIIFITGLLIAACTSKTESRPASGINVEMLGSWSNDSGCKAKFDKVNNHLILANFSDGKNNLLNNIILISKKESIMTTFKSQNSVVDFSGNFLEGAVTINSYCTGVLHKIDNN